MRAPQLFSSVLIQNLNAKCSKLIFFVWFLVCLFWTPFQRFFFYFPFFFLSFETFFKSSYLWGEFLGALWRVSGTWRRNVQFSTATSANERILPGDFILVFIPSRILIVLIAPPLPPHRASLCLFRSLVLRQGRKFPSETIVNRTSRHPLRFSVPSSGWV